MFSSKLCESIELFSENSSISGGSGGGIKNSEFRLSVGDGGTGPI